jgi:hypothetical protein
LTDGIMSALIFDLSIEPHPDQKGDRVRVSMSGKIVALPLGGAPFSFLGYYNGFWWLLVPVPRWPKSSDHRRTVITSKRIEKRE